MFSRLKKAARSSRQMLDQVESILSRCEQVLKDLHQLKREWTEEIERLRRQGADGS